MARPNTSWGRTANPREGGGIAIAGVHMGTLRQWWNSVRRFEERGRRWLEGRTVAYRGRPLGLGREGTSFGDSLNGQQSKKWFGYGHTEV